MTSFALTVEQDPNSDDLVLVFPPEWIEKQGWRQGDNIQWSIDGTPGAKLVNLDARARAMLAAQEKEELPLFIVETVLSHRMRYAIRARSAEHAMDTVTCREQEGLQEYDQNYLDELIFSTRQVGLAEYLASFDVPSDPDLKMRYVHTIAYPEPKPSAQPLDNGTDNPSA